MKKYVRLIGFIAIVIIAIVLCFELDYKKELFYKEKIYDLQLQFKDEINSYQTITSMFAGKITANKDLLRVINTSLEDKKNQDIYKNKTLKLLSEDVEFFKGYGIEHVNFYLADGRSLLGAKNNQNYCINVKEIDKYKIPSSSYEVGDSFEGIRYLFPMLLDGKFLGVVEFSVDIKNIISAMHNALDAKYSFIVKKSYLENLADKNYLKIHYHKSCISDDYYMHSNLHNTKIINKDIAKGLASSLKSNLSKNKEFVINKTNGIFNSYVYVFIPVFDCKKQNVAYFISKREDSSINILYFEQLLKFIMALGMFYIFDFLYRKNLKTLSLLDQYKNVVDQTTLVSKTDLKGRITYVNDAFLKLSGYDKDELIGKPHSVVRHSDMPSEVFEELWNTIKSGKQWHGKVKNRKKDGSSYTVDATIFPIKNDKNKVIEYIAIRYDITELEALKELLTKELTNSNQTLKEKMNLLAQYEKAMETSASLTRTDLNGIITYLNETHEKITGYKKEELIGHTHALLRSTDVASDFYIELWNTIKSKKNWNGVVKNIAKDGKIIYMDTLIVPILDTEENIVEYMSIQYDISDVINIHKEIEDTQREVIYKMGEIGESRSKETGNHVKRVAEYSRLLAIKYGLDEKEAELLYDASPMHDIGKVGIPDNVLKKPGKLDESEWEIMRSHSEIGYSVLKGSNREILKAASTVAYEHHEKFDGSGYPRGLKGEDIHIFGRITAVADVFDALGSDRVYKKAWEDEQIFELFRDGKGKHFDPKLVDIFFENLEEFLAIRDKFRD